MLFCAAHQMQTSPTFRELGEQKAKGDPEDPLLIVDGHCYAYRAFFGMASLRSPSGQPTNAIYGFIRMLGKMQARLRPSRLLVVWDGGLAAERMSLLPEYKAQRPDMPADLRSQLDPITHYLRAAGVFSWMREGCEADDAIAATTLQAAAAGLPVVIASSDKDFMQLVSEQVRLLIPHDKTEMLWDAAQVRIKTGVEPAQIVDWLSLVGDAVDNIPGVQGVGPKTAADLLRQFGSVDVMYQRLSEVRSERLRINLQAAEERVRRNQQLVRLKDDMRCDFSLEDLAAKEGDTAELRRLYSTWGFKRLLAGLDETLLKTGDFFHEHAHAV
jgi:DNA polymerase-1